MAIKFVKFNPSLEVFSDEFKINYINSCVNFLSGRWITNNFKTLTPIEKIEILLKGWNTWDNYSTSIIYIRLISIIIKTNTKKMLNNKFIKMLLELMIINIHPNFNRRLSIAETITKFNEIISIAAFKFESF